MNRLLKILLFLLLPVASFAQFDDYNQITEDGNITTGSQRRDRFNRGDSTQAGHKEVPVGLRVWTVDRMFGDIRQAEPDTLSYMFMNSIFTNGLYGDYNFTGNLGSPRQNRIATDRQTEGQFIFTHPYDYFLKPIEDFHFTNTLSPITNLSYNECGDRTKGENHFKVNFAANAGKKIGGGFIVDYLYGRGYYSSQNTSLMGFNLYGSYIGDRYQAHLLVSTNHMKLSENGGVTNDNYITHPESYNQDFQASEIPTVLEKNWNRNDNQHVFLTHRYNVGFNRKVPMTKEEIAARSFNAPLKPEPVFTGRPEGARVVDSLNVQSPMVNDSTFNGQSSMFNGSDRILVTNDAQADSLIALEQQQRADTLMMKDEYVPVTSFIHTLQFDNYKRIYEAYKTPADYYLDTFHNLGKLTGDSIYDLTRHYELRNTFAIALMEGFNKYAKAGLKVFANSYLRHFELPQTGVADENTLQPSTLNLQTFNEHNLSIGGQINKTEGHTLHYTATAETFLVGKDAGSLKLDATADLNFPLFGDTVTLAAKGFIHRLNPSFYYRHYHSKHFWWDNDDLDKTLHTHLEGLFHYAKTRTTLRIAADEIENYVYLGRSFEVSEGSEVQGVSVNMRQTSKSLSLLTLSLHQDVTLGPLNWESIITYQKSSEQDILPVPDLNIYTNLFLRFKIAKVLKCDLGADMRYFTAYNAPAYSPALGQFCVQEQQDKVEIGNYPIIDVYANFHLKHTRFFVMMQHINAGSGRRAYFLSPHYPINERVFRFGLSWNFFN